MMIKKYPDFTWVVYLNVVYIHTNVINLQVLLSVYQLRFQG